MCWISLVVNRSFAVHGMQLVRFALCSECFTFAPRSTAAACCATFIAVWRACVHKGQQQRIGHKVACARCCTAPRRISSGGNEAALPPVTATARAQTTPVPIHCFFSYTLLSVSSKLSKSASRERYHHRTKGA